MIVKLNYDLTDNNSYKIRATCSKALFVENEDDLFDYFKDDVNPIIIGGGYNIILSKAHYEEDFLLFGESFASNLIEDNVLTAEAGISMYDLSLIALDASLSGLEMFYDIPSSLGGAVVMNAGAGGEEIKDLILDVRYFNPNTRLFSEISKDEIAFEYRNSFFQKNPHLIITRVRLMLRPHSKDQILEKMESIKSARMSKQPKEYPNAGSVFKRPPGRFVGPMIEELGLKGFSVGGAKVSEKHGGFIINYNNATGRDILDLINIVKEKVYSQFGVNLEIEQRII